MFNNKIYSHLINISLKYNKNFISFNNNFRKIENSIYYEKSFENTYNQNKTEYSIFKLSTFHNTIKKNFFQKTKFLQNINKTENFYNVLGVDRNSTNDQIKQAYLKLAKQFHPDVNKEIDADEKFKNITLAYEALSNKKNRELYDATMDVDIKKNNWNYWKEEEEFARKDNARAKQDRKGGFYKNAYDSNFWKGEREDFEEKFYKEYENIFGSGWKESKSQKGEDILLEISISLFDSYNGATKGINFERKEKCHSCNGMRTAKGTRPSKCFACNATGEIKSKKIFKSS